MLEVIEKLIKDEEISTEGYDLVLTHVKKILRNYSSLKVSYREVTNQLLLDIIISKDKYKEEYHDFQKLLYIRLNIYTAFRKVVGCVQREYIANPEEKTIQQPKVDFISIFIDSALFPIEKQYLYQRVCQGYNVQEIAELSGEKPRHIRRSIQKAKRKIKDFINKITTEYASN